MAVYNVGLQLPLSHNAHSSALAQAQAPRDAGPESQLIDFQVPGITERSNLTLKGGLLTTRPTLCFLSEHERGLLKACAVKQPHPQKAMIETPCLAL